MSAAVSRACPQRLSYVHFAPAFRLACAGGCAAAVAGFGLLDGLVRLACGRSPLAPAAADLWLGVALGAAVGGLFAMWERVALTRWRAAQLALQWAPLRERLRWRYQRVNLATNGWLVGPALALVWWSAEAEVFVLPPLAAVCAVGLAANRRLSAAFRADLLAGREGHRLDGRRAAEPRSAPDAGRENG